MHKSRCVHKQLPNLFFMKATVLNVCLSSTDPITWTTIISSSFMYSKRLKLRTTNVKILWQKLIKGLNWFSSCNIVSKLCNMVILKWLDYKSSMWVESNGWTSWSNPPILWGLQKATFNVLRWEKKSSAIVESTTQYCGYTTPKAIMISYSRNHISSFEISPWVAPSHSSLTLFTTMPKATLVIGWKVVAPSM